MKLNEGILDRSLRFLLAALLFGGAQYVHGLLWASILLYGASAIMALTAAVGWCPIYSMLGISTRGRKSA